MIMGKKMRKMKEKNIPFGIIFITGYAEEDLTDYLDQITHIVTKPFSIDSLADGINCI